MRTCFVSFQGYGSINYVLGSILLVALVQAQCLDERSRIDDRAARYLKPSEDRRQAMQCPLLARRLVHTVPEGDVVKPQLQERVRLLVSFGSGVFNSHST